MESRIIKLKFFLVAFLKSLFLEMDALTQNENYLGETKLQPQLVSGKHVIHSCMCVYIPIYMYNIYLNNYI